MVLGRPKGRKTAPEKHPLHAREGKIRQLAAQGLSNRAIAHQLKVDRGTVNRFIRARGIPTRRNPDP